ASTSAAPSTPSYLPVRQDWLDRRKEPILAPDVPIVDPHHHLWDRPDWRYLLDELLADTESGHNIVATVFVQARAMTRPTGPVEMRPVGETEFVNGVAAMSASGIYGKTRHCAGIVGHADLTLGSRVGPVLAAHIRAGGNRFRGIRHIAAWDADASIRNPAYSPPPARMFTSNSAGLACAWAVSDSTSSLSPRHPRRWPTPGAPISRPASMPSPRRDACSRATSPSTKAPTATRCSGTPASFWRKAPVRPKKVISFVPRQHGSTASTCPADAIENEPTRVCGKG